MFRKVTIDTLLDPSTYPRVWNDSFLKPYATALIKRQWGQNMSKFQGVKLPGGIELNGMEMYEQAEKELERIRGSIIKKRNELFNHLFIRVADLNWIGTEF